MRHAITYVASFGSLSGLRDRFWSAFFAERECWVLWSPVALGVGISAYFALPVEPAWFAGSITLAVSLAGLFALGRGTVHRLVRRGRPVDSANRGLMVRCGRYARITGGVTQISNPHASPFVRDVWQRRLGIEEFEAFGEDGLDCDGLGCTCRLCGQVVSVVENPLAFAEECRRADILISFEPIPRSCRGGERAGSCHWAV